MHDIQQLPLVLMNALDLNIEQRGRIHFQLFGLINQRSQLLLVGLFDLHEFLLEGSGPGMRFEPADKAEIGDPSFSEVP